jgi:hypothetical protein
MRMIWTKSNLPLSVFIRAICAQDCSHFAFVFDSPAGGLLFESNLLGTHPKFFLTAKKHFEIIHEIEIVTTPEIENQIWDSVVNTYDGREYDFGGALYIGWRSLLNRFFGIPIPEKNKWSSRDDLFCDAISSALAPLQIPVAGPMDSPHDYYERIQGFKCFVP